MPPRRLPLVLVLIAAASLAPLAAGAAEKAPRPLLAQYYNPPAPTPPAYNPPPNNPPPYNPPPPPAINPPTYNSPTYYPTRNYPTTYYHG